MSISVTCPTCNRTFSVPDSYRGKKAKCPCGAAIVIPDDSPAAASSPKSAPSRPKPGMKPAREHLPIYNNPKPASRVPHVEHQRVSDRLQQRRSSNPVVAYIGIGGAILAVAVVLIVMLSTGGNDAAAPVGELPEPEEQAVVEETPQPGPIDLMTLIPADAGVFGMIDAKKLTDSGMLASMVKDVQPLMEGAGFDPAKDVYKVLFCASADGSAMASAAQGNFDAAAVAAAVAAKEEQWVYKNQKFAPLREGAVFGLTKNGLLLIGEEAGVKKLVDVMRGGPAIDPNSPAAKRAAELSDNTVWLIAMADERWNELLSELHELEAGAIKSIAFSGNVLQDGIELKLVLDCKNAATAKYVAESLQEESAVLSIPDIKFESEQNAATIAAKLDRNTLEWLPAMMMSTPPQTEMIQPEEDVEEEPVEEREPQPFREYDPWEMREIE